MTRTFSIAALVAAASLLAHASPQQAPPPAPQPQTPVFRAGADVVGVEASVRRDRRAVIGLTAADFEITDNGVPQQIADISYEKLPVDVTVLLDVSASVTGSALDELRRALKQLRADLTPADRMRLLTFNMRVRRAADFTDPPGAADAALTSLGGAGSSAVFDSLAVAMSSAPQAGRRHLIVLFSDGQDSSSISDSDTVLDVARRTTPTVAVVLPSTVRQRPASLLRATPRDGLLSVGDLADQVAAETGGFVAAIAPGENLTSIFRRVLEQFRASYVLYFTPTGVERVGPHTLDVRVKRPGAEVRARRSYVYR